MFEAPGIVPISGISASEGAEDVPEVDVDVAMKVGVFVLLIVVVVVTDVAPPDRNLVVVLLAFDASGSVRFLSATPTASIAADDAVEVVVWRMLMSVVALPTGLVVVPVLVKLSMALPSPLEVVVGTLFVVVPIAVLLVLSMLLVAFTAAVSVIWMLPPRRGSCGT